MPGKGTKAAQTLNTHNHRRETALDYKPEPKQQEPQLICLCAACASAFYNVPTIRIKRADRYQFVKDTCTYCGIRSGYDYIVAPRKVLQRHSGNEATP